jgi:hypothetical protein
MIEPSDFTLADEFNQIEQQAVELATRLIQGEVN